MEDREAEAEAEVEEEQDYHQNHKKISHQGRRSKRTIRNSPDRRSNGVSDPQHLRC